MYCLFQSSKNEFELKMKTKTAHEPVFRAKMIARFYTAAQSRKKINTGKRPPLPGLSMMHETEVEATTTTTTSSISYVWAPMTPLEAALASSRHGNKKQQQTLASVS